MRSPSPTPRPPAQGSSARKISPYNFWLQNPAGIEWVEENAGVSSSSSQRTHTGTHLLRLTPSELQHRGSSVKGTSGIWKETEASGIKARAGGQLFHRQKGRQRHMSFFYPSTAESQSWQAGGISETPSTWLTLFAPPWKLQ